MCEFPDVALRAGCMPEEVLGFRCPAPANVSDLAFGDHARYPKADDCRFFFKVLLSAITR